MSVVQPRERSPIGLALVRLAQIPSVIYQVQSDFWSVSREPDLYNRMVEALDSSLPLGHYVLYIWLAEENRLSEKSHSKSLDKVPSYLKSSEEDLSNKVRTRDATPVMGSVETSRVVSIPLIYQGTPVGGLHLIAKSDFEFELDANVSTELEALGNSLATQIYVHWLLERWNTLIQAERDMLLANDVEEVFLNALKGPSQLLNLSACWGFRGSAFWKSQATYIGPTMWRRHKAARAIAVEALVGQSLAKCICGVESNRSTGAELLQSFLAVPLVQDTKKQGVLVFASKDPERFGDAECYFLQQVGQAALWGMMALDSRAPLYALGIIGSSSTTLIHDLNLYGSTVSAALDKVKKATALTTDPELVSAIGSAEYAYLQINQLLSTIGAFINELKKDTTLARQSVNVPNLVEQVLARERSQFSQPYVKLTYNDASIDTSANVSYMANCNAVLLDRFLVGLLQNSLASIRRRAMHPRRKRPGSFRGEIRVQTFVQEGKRKISIRDNGIGFRGGRGREYRPLGTGFLLPLAEDVITKFWKGRVEIEKKNEVGGATVVISLPLEGG